MGICRMGICRLTILFLFQLLVWLPQQSLISCLFFTKCDFSHLFRLFLSMNRNQNKLSDQNSQLTKTKPFKIHECMYIQCDFSFNISHLKKNLSKIINALNFPVEFYFYCVLISRFPSFPFLGSLFLAAASIAGNLGSCICAQCTMNNFLFLKPIIPWSIVTLN